MEAILHLDDALAHRLGVGSPEELSVSALRSLVADAYRREQIGLHEVGRILSIDRWQAEKFLEIHHAQRPYSIEDLSFDRANLQRLGSR
jgi:hypothetical protein